MLDVTTCLAFDDILLVPTYTEIKSRLDTDISTYVGSCRLRIPMISSPMDTVTDSRMAIEIGKLGGMGIIHRYLSPMDQAKELCRIHDEIEKTQIYIPIVASVGVKQDEMDRFLFLRNNTPHMDMVCIDVANGHSPLIKNMIDYVRNLCGTSISIMAGNVATGEGFEYLAEAGANAVRIGIGSGAICSTRIKTGFGIPVLSSIIDASATRRKNSKFTNVSIIADGGIRYPADLIKSLAVGADAIMVGKIFAGTDESPGETLTLQNGSKVKTYRGMASRHSQDERHRGGLKPGTTPEGVSTQIPYVGPLAEVVNDFTGGLRSGMTYANAKDISELRKNAKIIRITDAGLGESHAFGTRV